jgi:hydrophobic/amphiphilic exporter-1 (mainly G- bacteria), HAE1 family
VSLFELVVRRPVATWMMAIAAAVFGLVSYERLPLNLMPSMAYPTITVRTEVTGYAPEEVESQISRRVEEALATTAGLVEIESRSRAGISDVVLEFAWGTGMDEAAQSVREQLQTTFLPADATKPLILRYDPNLDPVLRIALALDSDIADVPTGPAGQRLLRQIAEQEIKRTLEAMEGVASVRVRGGLESEVRVEVKQAWLNARSVTIDQVISTLKAENVNVPGGAILEGDHEYLVRTVGELLSIEEIGSLAVRRADGVRVPLRELAAISEGHRDREVVSLLGGREAVELEVHKTADANIVRLSQEVRDRLGEASLPEAQSGWPTGPPSIRSTLPEGVDLVVLEDQAAFIEASLSNLRSTAFLGAFLAVAVLFAFLRDFRATAIIATAIPLSIVCTFAPMYMGGVSLNLMSLGGLALGIGMLVDNAVVVLENIQVHREAGKSRSEAAVTGASEVAAAVTASTLTTVCVFLPIGFVEGVAGQLFGDLSLAVVFSLLASLVVALFFVPMLAASDVALPALRPPLQQVARSSRFGSVAQLKLSWTEAAGWARLARPYYLLRFCTRLSVELMGAMGVGLSALFFRPGVLLAGLILPVLAGLAFAGADRFQSIYQRLARRYSGSLGGLIARPWRVLAIAVASVLLSLPVWSGLGQALIPELHQGRFTAEIALPVGTPLSHTVERVREIEASVLDHPEIAHVHTVVGTERRADSRPDEGEHTARIMVELKGGGDLLAREEAIIEVLRSAVESTDGLQPELRIRRPSLFTFRTPIEVIVYDRSLERLRSTSGLVQRTLGELSILTDVRTSLTEGYPEVRIRYDRDLLARHQLTTAQVAQRVREGVLGEAATTLSRDEGRVDLSVRLHPEDRRGLDSLKRINVNPRVNPPIPLSAVAVFETAVGPSEIRRVDQRRSAVITANMVGLDLSAAAVQIEQAMAELALDGDWELAGQNREMQRSMGSMLLALGLAIFLIYVIMASTFESVVHPFVIMLSVPLALVGVVMALSLTGTAVSVVVLIGAIVLCGVVVNNAIVLVDTINRQRAAGLDRIAAIHKASTLRLRPILITTLTTVLGLLPLALGMGEGAELQRPLALTIISGLLSATLLTLVVIPAVYQVVTGALERRAEQAS